MSEKLSKQVRNKGGIFTAYEWGEWRDQIADEIAEFEEKLNNPICHRGHSDYPLTLWDCPTCVQNEKTQLEAEIQRLRVRVLGDGITRLEALEKNADEKYVAPIGQKIEIFEKINIELLKSNLSSIAMVDSSGQIALDYIVQLEAKLAETTKTGEELIDERDDIIASFEADNAALRERNETLQKLLKKWVDRAEQLETCDLCDEPAEYRQCQGCMNDKLVGSHTDEEYRKLETFAKNADETVEKLIKEKHALHDNLLASTSNAVQLGIQLETDNATLLERAEKLEAVWCSCMDKYVIKAKEMEKLRKAAREYMRCNEMHDVVSQEEAIMAYNNLNEALQGGNDETKNEIPPKVGRKDVEHPHPKT